MAASLLPTQVKKDFKEEFLTCSICSESYDNDEHKAKCLPCLHTYCKLCLQKIAGKRSKMDCPKCRKIIIFPGGTVDSLPTNFLVENLKEYQSIFNRSVQICGNCDDDNTAVSLCYDCRSFQCQNCTDYHIKMIATRHHQLVTMEELQAKKYNPMMQQHGTKHLKQDMTLYYGEAGCKVPDCATCGHPDHRGHGNGDNITISKGKLEAKQGSQLLTVKNKDDDTFSFNIGSNYKSKRLQVKVNANDMKGSPFTTNPDVDPHRCIIHFRKPPGGNAWQKEAIIQSVNCYGDKVISNAKIEATQGGNSLHVQDNFNGTYQFQFDSHKNSRYLHIKINGSVMRGSPFNTVFQVVDPQKCTIKLGLSAKRNWNKAIVQLVDSDGCLMKTSDAKVEATTQKIVKLDVCNKNDGTYIIPYQSYGGDLHVKINGTPMKGSPFYIV